MIEFLRRAYVGLKDLLGRTVTFLHGTQSPSESERHSATHSAASMPTPRTPPDPMAAFTAQVLARLLEGLRVPRHLADSLAHGILDAFEARTGSVSQARPMSAS